MNDLRELHNYSAPLHQKLPMAYFVEPEKDGVMLIKNGAPAVLIGHDGVDTECLDAVDVLDKTIRFEQAVRFLDHTCRLYQYQVKRRAQSGLFNVQLAQSIIMDPPTSRIGSILSAISSRIAERREAEMIEARVAELRSRARRFTEHLSDFRARQMDSHAAFRFLAQLLNYDAARAAAATLRGNGPLDWQLCMSEIEANRGIVRVGSSFAKVLTLKTSDPEAALPESTVPDLLRRIREAQVESILITEFKPIHPAAARQKLIKIAEEHNRQQYKGGGVTALAGALGKVLHPEVSGQDAGPRKDVVASGSMDMADEARKKLAFEGMMLGEFAMMCIVIGQSEHELRIAADEIQKEAVKVGVALYEEETKAHMEWFAALPGGERLQARTMTITEHVHGDVSLIFAPAKGSAANHHLNGPCLMDLQTRQGTPYGMNLNDDAGHGDVHHAVMLGKTGSGKTYKCKKILAAAREKYDATVIIFDMKDSYEEDTYRYGGSYMRVGQTGGFNPLSLEATEQNLRFMDDLVALLINRNGFEMESAERKEVWSEIAAACSVFPVGDERRRLGSLVLPARLRPQIEPWVNGGKYSWLFDNVNDTLSFATWQASSFAGFDKQTIANIGEPLLYYMLHRATQHISAPENNGRFKLFLLDEAWLFFKNETVREYVKEALKTWRERKGGVLLATQSGADIEQSEIFEAIVESVSTQILLANPGANRDWYKDNLGLNDIQVEHVISMQKKQEFMVVQDGIAKVVRLIEQPESRKTVKEIAA